MKAVILLIITSCLFVVASAQTFVASKDSISVDSTHRLNDDYFKTHFLWFTGHWNDKKNVFTTTPNTQSIFDTTSTIGGGGITITASPQGTVNIQSSNADEWNKKVDNGLKELQKFEDELKAPSTDAKEWGHHFEEVTLPVLDGLQKEWKGYKIDSKQLLSVKQDEKEIEQQRGKELRTSLFANCEKMKPEYERIMAFYKAHKHDGDADLTYPPPPAYTYQCYSCDTSLEQSYQKQDEIYAEKFFKPESEMIKTCLGMMHDMALLGVDKGLPERGGSNYDLGSIIYDAFNGSSNDPSKNGPCSYMHYDELNKVVTFLIMRNYFKAVKLFKDYKKNIQTARAVIRTLLSATRDAELWGLKID
ncbi:MAG TPA: hypothetical protein VLS85_07885, partial [Hanamia sp.]|nr:hypothetical protein [Hanamia sp.]